jgi:hypothetical protein
VKDLSEEMLDYSPEELWNEILNEAYDEANDDTHTINLIEVEASHDSPLWTLDGVEIEYPDYRSLDDTLVKVFNKDAYIIFVLYEMVIVEHEGRPEKVKVVALDESGCVIHV